jgi:hypothetical protein
MPLEWNELKALRQARFTMLTCAYVAPALYGGAISMQTLGGRWQRFFQSLARIPWQQPRVPWIAALALAALTGALVLPPRLALGSTPLTVLRGRNLLAALLLLGCAICGLYMGMKVGFTAAPLAFAMLAFPPVAGFLLFPTEERWRRALGS